ncbi:hypothetical protein BJV82DRAFT_193700 [Fennellomyces sp. T-0311]|nr:hypothetical protein BJV82DRAFT_193700 [Fennellomyces sp. T-0311]
MTVEPVKTRKQGKRPRCPYANCKTTKKSFAQLFDHIRELHDPAFPEFRIVKRLYTFKAEDGRIIDFQTDEKYALGPDEKITVEKRFYEGTKLLYCPYDSCSFVNNLTSNIYYHIRTCHDVNFPMLISGRSYIIKTEEGKIINFDDVNVRDTVRHSAGLLCDIVSSQVPEGM